MSAVGIGLFYLVSAFLFILGLKLMGKTHTARKGNLYSALGMLIAVVATLIDKNIITYEWILVGLAIGGGIGIYLAKTVKMTDMPGLVAMLNGFGGLASACVGAASFIGASSHDSAAALADGLSIFIGAITFPGSMVAWAKLKELFKKSTFKFRGQNTVNAILVLAATVSLILFVVDEQMAFASFCLLWIFAFIFGILFVLPIGGADMPVVISLLNSFTGLSACAAGFAVQNNLLIIAGALVGASGMILTTLMCKAMNRTLRNVIFSGLKGDDSSSSTIAGEVKPISVEDSYAILEAAQSICIVPGYGLAVAQAQHAIQELASVLQENGTEVKFAIHPVAGRMPGHMNVLLAEANVPYEQLAEMDAINPIISTMDVCLVVGANDVVNPAAHEDKNSQIYGMPIIHADKAKTVIVLKRSMRPGYAGIENALFYKGNTRMLFGDAKAVLQSLVAEFKH